MTGERTIETALRCYPAWWRERYGDEARSVAADLAAEGRSPSAVAANLLWGAVRARVRARGMPKVYELWATRTRLSVATATLPWLLVTPLLLAAVGTQSLRSPAGPVFYSGFSPAASHLQIAAAPPRPAPPLLLSGSIAAWASLAMGVLLLVTLVVLVAGWTGLTGAVKRSQSAERRRLRLLAWVPAFAVLVDLALFVAEQVVRPHAFRSTTGGPFVPLDGHPAAAHAIGTVLAAAAISGWLLSVVCVAITAKRADIAPEDLRFGRSVSTVVATLFAAFVAAYAVWGIALIVQDRMAAHGSSTVISYTGQGFFGPLAPVALVAAVVSVLGARAAVRSWRVIATELP